MSEFERPDRTAREPTVEDVRQLMGASTPHFALQIRNRIRNLIEGLPEDHPARREGELEIRRLDLIAVEGEHRGGDDDLPPMPSLEPREGEPRQGELPDTGVERPSGAA